MDLIKEHNAKYMFFHDITGVAMRIHRKYHSGLLESAYEAALKYLLEQEGYKVERQVYLPMYWEDVQLDQTYRMDLVVDDEIILELKAVIEQGGGGGGGSVVSWSQIQTTGTKIWATATSLWNCLSGQTS